MWYQAPTEARGTGALPAGRQYLSQVERPGDCFHRGRGHFGLRIPGRRWDRLLPAWAGQGGWPARQAGSMQRKTGHRRTKDCILAASSLPGSGEPRRAWFYASSTGWAVILDVSPGHSGRSQALRSTSDGRARAAVPDHLYGRCARFTVPQGLGRGARGGSGTGGSSSGLALRAGKPRAWVFAVAANLARDEARAAVRRSGHLACTKADPVARQTVAPALPRRWVEHDEQVASVQEALST